MKKVKNHMHFLSWQPYVGMQIRKKKKKVCIKEYISDHICEWQIWLPNTEYLWFIYDLIGVSTLYR